jgi:hypothetical protein
MEQGSAAADEYAVKKIPARYFHIYQNYIRSSASPEHIPFTTHFSFLVVITAVPVALRNN